MPVLCGICGGTNDMEDFALRGPFRRSELCVTQGAILALLRMDAYGGRVRRVHPNVRFEAEKVLSWKTWSVDP
eukprot:scaffold3909_cov231-Pinguiococcus_pyrenoidosus.AAC.1